MATASPEGFQEPSSAGGFNRRDLDDMEAHGGHAWAQHCRLFLPNSPMTLDVREP